MCVGGGSAGRSSEALGIHAFLLGKLGAIVRRARGSDIPQASSPQAPCRPTGLNPSKCLLAAMRI